MGGTHEHGTVSGGFVARRDPRAKILAVLAIVVAVVLAPRESWRVGGLGGLALALGTLGGIAPWRVLGRGAIVLPFAVLGAAFLPFQPDGWRRFLDVVSRAYVSGLAVATLALATDLPDFVRGLGGLGAPRALVLTMTFTVRYLGVLREEARRLALARELRTFGWRPRLALAAMGHSVGTLFVRTYERAERVHAAMAARGFDGSFPSLAPPRLGLADIALPIVVAAAAAAITWVP